MKFFVRQGLPDRDFNDSVATLGCRVNRRDDLWHHSLH